MRGDDAKKLCPDLHIFTVPEKNGKADLTRYRNASVEVFTVIQEFIEQLEEEASGSRLIVLERASVDEAYLDLTKYIDSKPLILPGVADLEPFNTKLVYNDLSLEEWMRQMAEGDSFDEHHLRLIMGALVMGQLRKRIFGNLRWKEKKANHSSNFLFTERTQFRCSAGVGHNKMLAKLVCGANKPNAQTILPFEGVPFYFENIKISNVRNFGGKFGQQVRQLLATETMGQLMQIDQSTLEQHFDKPTANLLHDCAMGIDTEPVMERLLTKSIGCGKNFRGKQALGKLADVEHWVKVLCEEAHERMEIDKLANKRLAQQVIIGYSTSKGQSSKTIKLNILDGNYPAVDKMANDIMKAVFLNMDLSNPIINLSLVATKFVDQTSSVKMSRIDTFFRRRMDCHESAEVPNEQADNEEERSALEELENFTSQSIDDNTVEEETDEKNTYNVNVDDLPPDRIEEIKSSSFFYRKILQLYDFNSSDSDSDIEFDGESSSEIKDVEDMNEMDNDSDQSSEFDDLMRTE